MPYDYTYQEDAEGFSIMRVVAAVIASLLIIAAVGAFVLDDAPRTTDRPEAVDTATLSVRTSNAAEMHKYGLPTKSDVMEWHMTGQWGFKAGSMFYVYGDLPGTQSAWDELYGIDPDNPAFDK